MHETTRFSNLKQDYEAARRKAEAKDASEEDKEAARKCCHEFKRRCQHDVNEIPQKLKSELSRSSAEKVALQKVYEEALEYLPKLEAKCPGDGNDPPLEPPARRGGLG